MEEERIVRTNKNSTVQTMNSRIHSSKNIFTYLHKLHWSFLQHEEIMVKVKAIC